MRRVSPIYEGYFRLGDTAYREKVRFFEEHPEDINYLDFDDRIELEMDYLLSLFEIGRYERYLRFVDRVIEEVILENIYTYRDENIFEELLFRKAASLYQLRRYDDSKILLKQLISIDKNNSLYVGLYAMCNRKIHDDKIVTVRATAMASFLIVLGITLANVFLDPFFDNYMEPFILLRTLLIFYFILSLLSLEILFQYRLYKETGMLSNRLLKKIFNN